MPAQVREERVYLLRDGVETVIADEFLNAPSLLEDLPPPHPARPQATAAIAADAQASALVKIPMQQRHVRSLNLATSVGIGLYEALRQLDGPVLPDVDNF